MTDYREELLNNAMMRMQQAGIADDDLDMIKVILVNTIGEYEITERCTELAVLDGSNDRILNTYLETKSASGRSKGTRKTRRSILKRFTDDVAKPYAEITTFDIMHWLYSKQGTIKLSSSESQRSVLSAFFAWLMKMQVIKANPMDFVEPIKHPKAVVKSFNAEEIEDLRRNCRKPVERAMIEVLLSSGIRCEELCNLKWEHINMNTKDVTVVEGKGGKSRITMIDDIARKYLLEYKQSLKIVGEYIFATKVSGILKKRSVDSVRSIINKLADRAGVKNAHPHRFRHTFATNLFKRGMDVHMIQLLLGHSNINTTMIYIDHDTDMIRGAYEKCV